MEDRCVCCGAIIPEGRHVCPICLIHVKEPEDKGNEDNKVCKSGV